MERDALTKLKCIRRRRRHFKIGKVLLFAADAATGVAALLVEATAQSCPPPSSFSPAKYLACGQIPAKLRGSNDREYSRRAGRAVSSVVEHHIDTVGVKGSNPLSRTILICGIFPARKEVSCVD